MKIVAHRGMSDLYPENTLLAFQKAQAAGADAIELDVHFTTDKRIIVHHYFELGQTENGEGYIFEKDAAYLRSLDAGAWFDSKYTGEKLPFIEEVFTALTNTIQYEIELKAYGKAFVDSLLSIVMSFNILPSIQFTSYQYPLLANIKKHIPQATVGFIAPPKPTWMAQRTFQEIIEASLIQQEIDVIHIPVDLYNQPFVDRLRTHHVKLHFGLADTKEQIQKAIQLGADELTTNHLQLALDLIKPTPNA